jgi:plastocyanin
MLRALALSALLAAPVAAGAVKGRLIGARALEGYVIWIDGGDALPALDSATARHTVNQINKDFSPKSVAIRAGDGVVFENLDNVFHNVFSLDKRNAFDVGLYKGKKHFGEDRKTPAADSGAPVEVFAAPGKYSIYCNIHPDMFGLVFVFGHGYFAQADKDGLFSLPVPASGVVILKVDGPKLKEPVVLKLDLDHPPAALEIAVKTPRVSPPPAHTKKDGSAYPVEDEANPY